MAVITGGNAILPNVKHGNVYLQNLISKTLYGTDGESDTIVGTDKYTSCIIQVKIAAHAGTSPTLNVYLQQLAADGTTWYDIASMTQITTVDGSFMQSFVGGAAVGFAVTDGSLAAGSTKAVPMGGKQRIKLDFGGTNPQYTFSVHIEYIP